MKRKKILFCIDSLNTGGAEKVLINIIRNLDREKFEITLCAVFDQGYYVDFIPGDVQYQYLFSRNNRFGFLSKIGRLIGLTLNTLFAGRIKKVVHLIERNDIIVSFCEGYNSVFFQKNASSYCENKLFLSWIHIDFRNHVPIPFMQKLYGSFKNYDKLIFVSNDARAGFLEIIDNNPNNFVLYNPIDWNEIEAKSEIKVLEIGEGNDVERCKIIAVGRLQLQKRFDRLLDAAKILKGKGYKFQLNILGEGELEMKLMNQIKSNDLEDCCFLRGFQTNVPSWIKSSDIFVMSSDYEGLPLVVCEAMVLAKPIVSTNITGPRELLLNGEFGLLCELDALALSVSLESLINDKGLREDYSLHLLHNREKFIFKNDISHIQQFIIESYDQK